MPAGISVADFSVIHREYIDESAPRIHGELLELGIEVSDSAVAEYTVNASAECSREMLQALADTYVAAQLAGNATKLPLAADARLDNWGNPDLPAPHGTPCARLEGRIFTRSRDPEGNTCDMGALPQPLDVGNWRYVIDENFGAVVIFHSFPWLDAGLPTDPGTPVGQMFQVEGGRNRYIHEATVCTTPACGRGG